MKQREIIALVAALLMVTAIMGVAAAWYIPASIWTDKADYQPEEAVYISGEGFQGSATVSIRVTRPDSTIETGTTVTDSNGNFFDYQYNLDGIEGEYTVVASDRFNSAETTFTDRILIPEFSTIALPALSLVGLFAFFSHRKRK
jgi:hypothetical protein